MAVHNVARSTREPGKHQRDEIADMASPKDVKPAAPPAPFTSLLAAGSLVFAVLLVAGFSYRWTSYYNFGL